MSSFGGDGGSGGGSASAPTEWEECMSKKHGKPFWFNRFTGESRWTPPEGMAVAGGPAVGAKTDATATAAKAPVSSSSGSKLSASAPSFTPLKAETESAGGDKASGGAVLVECPQNLQGKRDFLFRGFDPNKKSKFVIDEVASFSVTESQSADEMTNVIWAQFAARKRASLCILGKSWIAARPCLQPPISHLVRTNSHVTLQDGMACVGGNTISFAKKFSSVISNELDSGRYEILKHNTVEVAGCKGVEFRNDSILELVKREKFDILFLDPEWCV